MNLIAIEAADDPRIAAFRDIRERDLTGRRGLFIAEGEVVLRVLASPASLCRPVAVLIAEGRLEKLRDVFEALPGEVPIHLAPQGVLDAIAGFPLHRGVLALGAQPPPAALDVLIDSMPEGRVLVAACGIGNHDNIGGLFRNAAAFGAWGVAMDDRCCDPFYRKAIRVSAGAALRTSAARAASAEILVETLERRGVEVLALSPGAGERLADLGRSRRRRAVLLGSEGPGLPSSIVARCRAVRIPMAGGFDSLNVAATSAAALHQLTQVERPAAERSEDERQGGKIAMEA